MASVGRPKKSQKYGGHIVAAEDRIADRLPDLIDNMFALADGVRVQEETEDGGTRTYTTPPCFRSNTYLIDRIMGKPTQAIELGGMDGAALFPAANQSRLLRDPRAVELMCQLDEILINAAEEGYQPGGVCPRGEPGPMDVPAAPGDPES